MNRGPVRDLEGYVPYETTVRQSGYMVKLPTSRTVLPFTSFRESDNAEG